MLAVRFQLFEIIIFISNLDRLGQVRLVSSVELVLSIVNRILIVLVQLIRHILLYNKNILVELKLNRQNLTKLIFDENLECHVIGSSFLMDLTFCSRLNRRSLLCP